MLYLRGFFRRRELVKSIVLFSQLRPEIRVVWFFLRPVVSSLPPSRHRCDLSSAAAVAVAIPKADRFYSFQADAPEMK